MKKLFFKLRYLGCFGGQHVAEWSGSAVNRSFVVIIGKES